MYRAGGCENLKYRRSGFMHRNTGSLSKALMTSQKRVAGGGEKSSARQTAYGAKRDGSSG